MSRKPLPEVWLISGVEDIIIHGIKKDYLAVCSRRIAGEEMTFVLSECWVGVCNQTRGYLCMWAISVWGRTLVVVMPWLYLRVIGLTNR